MHLVVLGLVFALTAAGAGVTDLGDDPATFDRQVEAAYLSHDLDTLASVIADDVRFTHASGGVWTKSQWLEAARTHDDLERSVDMVDVERHRDIIETAGRIHVRPVNAAQQEHHFHYVRIYVRRDAMWQLISHRTVREANGPPPASTTGFPGAYRPGDGVTLPRVISEAKPQYTADAMRAKVQGSVLLECVVETDGTVGEVHLIRSLDRESGLDESAIRAAKQWRFTPGTRDGQPVPVIITIQMAFTLGKHH
jgi:TonB family protein